MGCRLVLGFLLIGACKAELGDGPVDGGNATDSNNPIVDAPSDDGQTALGPWGTPSMVPGASSALEEDDCTLSSTRTELFFKRSDSGDPNLYVMTRATPTSPWGAPSALTLLNSTVAEESPRLSPDDLTLYFGRNGDIYRTTRTSVGAAWMAPTAVTTLNTTAYEKWAAVCSGGYVMVSRSVSGSGQDLYEGTIAAGANDPVAQLNSLTTEQGTMLTGDCLRVYFQSNRDNSQFNIFTATRLTTSAPWTNPTPLADFNTATFNEEDAWISPDQRTFVYASNAGGNKDVYVSTR